MTTATTRKRPNFASYFAAPALVFAILVFAVPLVVILLRSLTDPDPGTFLSALQSGIFLRSLGTTFRMALVVTLVCLVISYPYAYVMARGGPGIRAVLLVAVMISFWTSTLVRTYAWQILLNDTGLINELLIETGVIDTALRMIRTDFAVYVGMAHVLAPFTILTIFAQLRTVKPELEQAARSLGARRSTTFWTVTLPLSLPGAVAGGILVFVLAMGFYVTPEILGDAKNIYLGSAIIQQIQVFLNTGVGAAESVILLALVLIVLFVAGRFVGINRILGIERNDQK
jgi:putative spermidine/putrescine transport system permease protein